STVRSVASNRPFGRVSTRPGGCYTSLMAVDSLAGLDATAQAELIRTRQASPRELVDAAIARLERLDPKLGSVIHPAFEEARAAAAAVPAGAPFAGVPTLMKD